MSIIEELRKSPAFQYQEEDVISRSPLMHKIFATLSQVAQSDCLVLIQGETGTGKELLARDGGEAFHAAGKVMDDLLAEN